MHFLLSHQRPHTHPDRQGQRMTTTDVLLYAFPKKNSSIFCVLVFCLSGCLGTQSFLIVHTSQKNGTESPGTVVIDGCEPSVVAEN